MIKFKNLPIRLLPINPRYTSFENVDFKNLNFKNYDEIKVAKELIKYEGNLEDLLELINTIISNGFLYLNDKILIHLDINKENFYILEGNRRILAIKLINKEIIFDNICGNKPYYPNIKNSEWMNNKKLILSKIKNANFFFIKDDWFLDVSNYENDLIWQTIYSKHVGEQIGKRDWSRAKYFDDLLKIYKKLLQNLSKEETINKLAQLFGKKIEIIKRDIQSAIWIIKSINIYNDFHKEDPLDLRTMEVSGYELVLSQKLIVNGKEKRLREILDIKIDDQNIEIKWDDKISKEKLNDIIECLVRNSLRKKITTREIKEEIYDELSDVIGYTLSNKRSLNFLYNQLKEKESLNESEKIKLHFLVNLKSDDVNINEFLDKKYDSKFIRAIKYTIRNDLKTLSNLKNFDEDEYPFTNVAVTIRNIIDLFIMEMIFRIEKIGELKVKFNLSDNDIKCLEHFVINHQNSIEHDVNKITGVIKNIVSSKGATKLNSFILTFLNEKYGNRLKELNIDLKNCESFMLQILSFKKDDLNKLSNFSLLNNLTHKPYYGFENSNNINMIDNLNIMFDAVKNLIKYLKIWEKPN